MNYGTCFFISEVAAVAYYAQFRVGASAVGLKLNDGEIHIGMPPLKFGDIAYADSGGRYWVTETDRPSHLFTAAPKEPDPEAEALERWRSAARRIYCDGSDDDCTIDEGAKVEVSPGDDGAWVQAWVWVRNSQLEHDDEV